MSIQRIVHRSWRMALATMAVGMALWNVPGSDQIALAAPPTADELAQKAANREAFRTAIEAYRKAKDFESKSTHVNEILVIEQISPAPLKKLVEADGMLALQAYGKMFGEGIDSVSIKSVEEVLKDNESLNKEREKVTQWALLAGKVSEAVKAYDARIRQAKIDERASKAKTPPKDESNPINGDGGANGEGGDNTPADTMAAQVEAFVRSREDAMMKSWLDARGFGQLKPEEVTAFVNTNRERVKEGLPELVIDMKLVLAARDHGSDMAKNNFFAHESPVEGKKTPGDRARNFGTTCSGENIAHVPGGGDAVEGWMNSPPHRKNILTKEFKKMGIGFHDGYFTQMFER